MHDRFEILGLPSNARAHDVRRAWARRTRREHPDFFDPAPPALVSPVTMGPDGGAYDAAVDFVHMGSLLDRVQAAFFADRDSSHA
jgi:hypothetical protein